MSKTLLSVKFSQLTEILRYFCPALDFFNNTQNIVFTMTLRGKRQYKLNLLKKSGLKELFVTHSCFQALALNKHELSVLL